MGVSFADFLKSEQQGKSPQAPQGPAPTSTAAPAPMDAFLSSEKAVLASGARSPRAELDQQDYERDQEGPAPAAKSALDQLVSSTPAGTAPPRAPMRLGRPTPAAESTSPGRTVGALPSATPRASSRLNPVALTPDVPRSTSGPAAPPPAVAPAAAPPTGDEASTVRRAAGPLGQLPKPQSGSLEEALTAGLSKDLGPSESTVQPPTSKLGKAAFALGQAAAHPVATAGALVAALPQSALTLARYTDQLARTTEGREANQDYEPVSRHDAAWAAGQLMAAGVVDATLPMLDAVFGRQMAAGIRAARANGVAPTVAIASAYAKYVAAHATGGALIGTAYSPQDPEMGAIVGAALGGAHAVVSGGKVRVPGGAAPEEGANLASHPDRLLGPQRVTPTEAAAPPAGPDYTVEDLHTAPPEATRPAGPLPTDEGVVRAAAAPPAPSGPIGPREYVPESSGMHVTEDQLLTRNIARGLKTGNPDAIAHAAPEMATRVPEGAVLVPMPDHTGNTAATTALANAIAKITGSSVIPALGRSATIPSSRDLRQKGKPGNDADAQEASMAKKADLPEGQPVVFVDNLESTGATAEGARRVLGRPDAQNLVFAQAPVPAGEVRATTPSAPKPAKAAAPEVASEKEESQTSPNVAAAPPVEPSAAPGGPGRDADVPQGVRPAPVSARAESAQPEPPAAGSEAARKEPPAAATTEEQPLTARSAVAGPTGHSAETFFSDGRTVKTRYRVVEADDLVPSHDALTFSRRTDYPSAIQGREYAGERGRAAREQVQSQTGSLRPSPLLDPGNGVSDGPPVVTPSGIAITGNQRSMMLQRASEIAPEKFQAYRAELEKRAASFGLDPETIKGMRAPVLVRELHDDAIDVTDAKALGELNRLSDQPSTKTKDQVTAAMGRAKAMQGADEAMAHLDATMEPDQTVRSYLGTAAGRTFVRLLGKEGVIAPQELPSFVNASTNEVHAAGRQSIEDMMLATAIGDPDVMSNAGEHAAKTLQKLGRAVPALIQAHRAGAGYSLQPQLQKALTILSRGGGAAQDDMFSVADPESTALARYLEAKPAAEIAEAMRQYAKAAQSATRESESEDMFGYTPESAESARQRIFNAGRANVAESTPRYGSRLGVQVERPVPTAVDSHNALALSSPKMERALAGRRLGDGSGVPIIAGNDGRILHVGDDAPSGATQSKLDRGEAHRFEVVASVRTKGGAARTEFSHVVQPRGTHPLATERIAPILRRGMDFANRLAEGHIAERAPAYGSQSSLFGDEKPEEAPQESMFDEKAGTAASRDLSQTERAAKSEIQRLFAKLNRTSGRAERAALTKQIAQLEKLLRRGEGISADEMAARARAGETREAVKNITGEEPVETSADAQQGRLLEGSPEYGAQTNTPEFKRWFGESKVVDANGKPLVVYHGSQRADRFGPRIIKGRASSGPMPFFTDDAAIASKYAEGKPDSSIPDEEKDYEAWFRLKLPGSRKAVNLDRAWGGLTPEQQQKISALAPRVTTDDTGENIILGDENNTRGNGGYRINEVHGNALEGLVQAWLTSGALFDDEYRFHEVLKLAGVPMDAVEFHDPNAAAPGVTPAFLSIEKPLVTNALPDDVVPALERASKRQRPVDGRSMMSAWDKRTQDPATWIAQLKEDQAKKQNSTSWTAIPDWVTKTLRSLGYDGIQDTGGKMGGDEHSVWIPFEPGQVKSATGNRGTFDRASSNILREGASKYGGEPSPMMSGLHNLSTENLVAADKLGGFPAPSLAVVPEHQPFSQYGRITMIARSSAFDPATEPVFDADAYSGRAPRPEYKAPSQNAVAKVLQPLQADFKSVDDTGSWSQAWNDLAEDADPLKAESHLVRSDGAKAAFLREIGKPVAPVMRDTPLRFEVSRTPSVRAFFAEHGVDHGARPGSEYWKGLTAAVERGIDESHADQKPKLRAALNQATKKQMFDEGGLSFGHADRIMNDQAKIGTRNIDTSGTREALDNALADHKPAFEQWVRAKIEPFMKNPRLKVGRKFVPYDLDAATESATRARITGAEETMTHGPGKARAVAATRFGSITHARNATHQIKPPADVAAAVDTFNKEVSEPWRDRMLEYASKDRGTFSGTWESLDNMHKALSDYLRVAPVPAAKARIMRQVMARYGFNGLPDDLVQESIEVARQIREMPLDYFEAKPQRAVRFDEFAGAVIPKDAAPEVKAILDRRGVPYREYQDENDRHEVTRQFRRELHEGGAGTLMERGATYDPEQFSLFQKAVENPKGPEAVARQKVEAEVSFGSEAKRDAAIGRHAKAIAALERSKLPTVGMRLGQVKAHAAQQRWVDFRGVHVKSTIDVAHMMDLMRDPKIERMSVFYFKGGEQATDPLGPVLAHTVETAGALNFVQLATPSEVGGKPSRWLAGVVDRAKRLGADRVVFGHNHPSGVAEASPEDQAFTRMATEHLKREGIDVAAHVVIDDGKFSLIGPSGRPANNLPFEPKRSSAPAYKTAPQSMTTGTPQRVAELLAGVVDPQTSHVVYVDAQHRVIAVEPRRDLKVRTMAKWLPAQLRALGANSIVVVAPVQAAVELHDMLRSPEGLPVEYTRGRGMTPQWSNDILDILAHVSDLRGIREVTPSGFGGGYVSYSDRGLVRSQTGLPRSTDVGRSIYGRRLGGSPRGGTERPGAGVRKPDQTRERVLAFHGSPHRFERFSTEHVGSGEGAQSFGYGLYFASRREIAQHYRDVLTSTRPGSPTGGSKYSVRGAAFPTGRSGHAALDLAMDIEGYLTYLKMQSEPGVFPGQPKIGTELADHLREKIPQFIKHHMAVEVSGAAADDFRALAKFWTEHASRATSADVVEQRGGLYHVSLPEESTFLLWDKPLREQPQPVKDALARSEFDDFRGQHAKAWSDETGEELYRHLASRMAAGEWLYEQPNSGRWSEEEAASRYLNALGVSGIKYLDNASRAAGEGTHNYVAFGDQDIDIKSVAEKSPQYGEEPERVVGVKNAASADERERLGMGEREMPEPRTQDEMYEAGKAAAAIDPTAIGRLIEQLRADPEKILGTTEEAGLLLKHRVDLDRQHAEITAAEQSARASGDQDAERLASLQLAAKRAEIREFIQLAERTGTATGRALAARKMMSALDYSLSNMEAMAESAKGSPLTRDELDRVKALHEELKVKLALAEKDATDARERAANAEADLHHAELRAQAMQPFMERVATKLDSEAEAARARIKARGLRASAGMDPVDLADHAILGAAQIAHGAARFKDWSAAMTRSLGESIQPHLREVFDAANKRLNDELRAERKRTAKKPKEEGSKDIRTKMEARIRDGANAKDLRPYLTELALEYIRAGTRDREPLLTQLHTEVRGMGLDATRAEVRDALSGYGEYHQLNRDADLGRLREIRAESQKLAQLDALQKGQAPLATGFEHQPPNDETRRLTQQVNEAKKRLGIGLEDEEGRLKSALSAAKTRTRNAIKDLQTEIDTRTRIVRNKSILIPDKELDGLRDQLADLRKTEAEVFQKPGLTDEQRIALATRAARRSAEQWEKRLAGAEKGSFAPGRPKPVSTPEIDAIRARAKAAREAYAELRSLDPSQRAAETARQNQQYRARLAEREAELLDRIARSDYSKKPLRPGTTLDAESIRRKGDVEHVKQLFREKLRAYEDAHQKLPERARNAWVHWVRFSALSWPTVIGKLTSVAISRVVTTPLTDMTALGVANALPGLALGAPRYGTASAQVALRSEARAWAGMWIQGIKGSLEIVRNRRSRLELLHGKQQLPPRLSDYMGRLHAALKEPIKEAEYARSLYRRTDEAAMRGENVTDPVVQLRLSSEAYLDAERAVSMNSNIVTDWWHAGLRRLEQKDKATGKRNPLGVFLSTAARTEMPIATAPTNVVLEASEYIAGLPIGGFRAAWAYAHGIENLSPVERDSILRMIAKGSLGLAIMALYFYKSHDDDKPVELGGFYQPGEKRAATDVPAGAARLGGPQGTVIPKNLLHNPLFMAGQFAATIGRLAPTKLKKSDEDPQGYGSALFAASIGLLDETPIVSSVLHDAERIADPKQRNDFVERKAADLAVPGLIQWVAKATDDSGVVRKPAGWDEHVEYNIPGLRENVPPAAPKAIGSDRQRRLSRHR